METSRLVVMSVGVCSITAVLLLLLRQLRATHTELRALRAHVTAIDAASPPPPSADRPDCHAERHGLHVVDDMRLIEDLPAVDDDPGRPRPARRSVLPLGDGVMAFLAATAAG